ncbi:MAG: hypothetical protein E7493_14135 [Ruminococcus albus]|nr:hypothetical protein [Ruminococcus albus]
MVIPLTHHKNGGFTELKVVGVWALNYPFVYSIFSWCAKGIVIFIIIYRHHSIVSLIIYFPYIYDSIPHFPANVKPQKMYTKMYPK